MRKLFELINRLREKQEGFPDRYVRVSGGDPGSNKSGANDSPDDASECDTADEDEDEGKGEDEGEGEGEGDEGSVKGCEKDDPNAKSGPPAGGDSDVEIVEVQIHTDEKAKVDRIALLQKQLFDLHCQIKARSSKASALIVV